MGSFINESQRSEFISVTVLVATYKRNSSLRELLLSLKAQDLPNDTKLQAVIVDNDPDESAEQIVAEFPDFMYVVEKVPGIAAARNRGLQTAPDSDYLAFIDDDEVADPRWIRNLLLGASQTGAEVIQGDVEYIFPRNTPRWIADGGFFIRHQGLPGSPLPFAATNNLLIDQRRLKTLGDFAFAHDLGLAGGSDSLITRQIVASGGKIAFWPDALVVETVPGERISSGWVLRRAMRTGESTAQALLRTAAAPFPRCRLAFAGAARVLGGFVRLCIAPIGGSRATRSRRVGEALRTTFRGIGFVRTALGLTYIEYKRL